MPDVTQENNSTGGGDIAARDVNKTYVTESQPHKYLNWFAQQYQAELASNTRINVFIDTLTHYNTDVDAELKKDLAQKLTEGSRSDEIKQATMQKELFVKLIHRHQFYDSAQQILCVLIAEIFDRFVSFVYPAIKNGATHDVVNALVHEKVLDPVMSIIDENPLQINKTYLRGVLFYLTSNCHINWSK